MRCFSNACFAAVILLAGTTMIGCNQTPELSIQIVPTSASTKVGKWIEIWWLENRFHVVITNTSDQRLGVWEQWCSWGWSTLSFELVTGSGEQVLVNRAPGEWSKNFPAGKIPSLPIRPSSWTQREKKAMQYTAARLRKKMWVIKT